MLAVFGSRIFDLKCLMPSRFRLGHTQKIKLPAVGSGGIREGEFAVAVKIPIRQHCPVGERQEEVSGGQYMICAARPDVVCPSYDKISGVLRHVLNRRRRGKESEPVRRGESGNPITKDGRVDIGAGTVADGVGFTDAGMNGHIHDAGTSGDGDGDLGIAEHVGSVDSVGTKEHRQATRRAGEVLADDGESAAGRTVGGAQAGHDGREVDDIKVAGAVPRDRCRRRCRFDPR